MLLCTSIKENTDNTINTNNIDNIGKSTTYGSGRKYKNCCGEQNNSYNHIKEFFDWKYSCLKKEKYGMHLSKETYQQFTKLFIPKDMHNTDQIYFHNGKIYFIDFSFF